MCSKIIRNTSSAVSPWATKSHLPAISEQPSICAMPSPYLLGNRKGGEYPVRNTASTPHRPEDALYVSQYQILGGTLPEDEYVRINRRGWVFILGQSQHIRGVIKSLSPATILQFPEFHSLIFQVVNTINSICPHATALLPYR